MPGPEESLCHSCGQPVDATPEDYALFEGMHWECFHHEFEHQGPRERACADPSCPVRATDPAPPPTWLDDLPR